MNVAINEDCQYWIYDGIDDSAVILSHQCLVLSCILLIHSFLSDVLLVNKIKPLNPALNYPANYLLVLFKQHPSVQHSSLSATLLSTTNLFPHMGQVFSTHLKFRTLRSKGPKYI